MGHKNFEHNKELESHLEQTTIHFSLVLPVHLSANICVWTRLRGSWITWRELTQTQGDLKWWLMEKWMDG